MTLIYKLIDSSKGRAAKTFLLFTLFVITLIFFTNIHPMTIISGDDWGNFSSTRPAYPQWKGFNPIKVMPETIMPYAGFIAAFFIKPLGIDYLFSLTIITALLVSLILTIFFNEFYIFLSTKLELKTATCVYTGIILYLYFFALLKHVPNNQSVYLLWEINITCYYHYIMPALMNGALAFYLMRKDFTAESLAKNSPIFWGIFFLVVYLCIFSNIFHGIISASVCMVHVLYSYLKSKSIRSTIKRDLIYIIIIFIWAISAIFEANGERAESFTNDGLQIYTSTYSFLYTLLNSNKIYRNILIISLVATPFIFSLLKLNNKEKIIKKYTILATIYFAITTSFLILVCAKSSPAYAVRPSAMWGAYMYLLMIACLVFSVLIERYRFAAYAVPTIIFILIIKAADLNTSLKEPHNLDLNYNEAHKVTSFIIEQVKDAESKNRKEMTLEVPKISDDIGNWPFPLYMGDSISKTLKGDGIIKKEIKITIHPNIEVNNKLNILQD